MYLRFSAGAAVRTFGDVFQEPFKDRPPTTALAEARTASTTSRPISVVEIAEWDLTAKSAVRAPCDSTAETAFSMHTASDSNWNECRSSIAADRIAPSGFA